MAPRREHPLTADPPAWSRPRAIVVGLVGGAAVALIATLALRDGGGSSPTAAAATAPSSTTVALPADGSLPTAPVDTAPAPGAPTTTTGASKGGDGATKATTTTVRSPTVVPPALSTPRPGRYRIKVVSDGTATTGSLVVTADGWQRRDLGSAGSARTEQLAWSDAGARLVASGEPGTDGACRWDGRSTSVPHDLKDARSWSSRITCDSEVDGQAVKVVRVETAGVTKRARTQLAGRSLDTWVIERRISVTIKAQDFTTTSESISTELFAPGLGLAVYSTSRTDVPLPDGTTRPVYASEEVLGLPS